MRAATLENGEEQKTEESNDISPEPEVQKPFNGTVVSDICLFKMMPTVHVLSRWCNLLSEEHVVSLAGLSDAELFQACGGRTAHKGARHGLKLNGKLARLAEQEQSVAAASSDSERAHSSGNEQQNR